MRGAIHSTKIQTGPAGRKRTTSKGGPVFSKHFRLDRTDPLSFGLKFPEILFEWIAPEETAKGEKFLSFFPPRNSNPKSPLS